MIIKLLMIIMLIPQYVYASEINTNMLNDQLNAIDFSEINYVIGNNEYVEHIDVRAMLLRVVAGEEQFSFQLIWDLFYNNIMNEIASNAVLIRNLIIISLLSALLKNLTDSFKETMVAEVAFYSCYIVLMTLLFSSFQIAISVAQGLIDSLTEIMQASVPIILALVYMSGSVGTATALNPIVLFAVHILSGLIRNMVVPIIIFASTIQMINYLSKKEILSKFASLIENSIGTGLKLTALAFIGVLSFQGITAPVFNNLINKTARAVVNVVPVVGDVLTSTIDIVATYTVALKSGAMAVIVMIIVTMCVIPILKLFILAVVYKMVAVFMQPICDERVIKCLDTAGNFTLLLLGATLTVSIMFIFSVVIVLSV